MNWLRRCFPALFPDALQNLKRREAYLPCLTAVAPCDDRHGNVSEEVSDAETALVLEQLAAIRAARRGRSH